MSLLDTSVGLAVGGALGYLSTRAAPRWLSKADTMEARLGLIAVTAGGAGLLGAAYGPGLYFWPQAVFLAILALAAYVDLHDRIIPNELVLFGLGAGAVAMLALPREGWGPVEALIGAAAGFGLLLALAVAVPGGMGFGDVKLAAVIGLFLGYPWIFMGMVLSFLAGGLAAGVLMALRRIGRKGMIPFGPFLAFGAAVTALFGAQIWNWYISL